MTLVSASATCAPVCTHLTDTPSLSMSFIARHCNCVRYSWQLGGAVRVMMSYNDLQSVMARSGGSLIVGAAYVWGSSLRVSLACFHRI